MYSRKDRPRAWINAGWKPASTNAGTNTERKNRPVPKHKQSMAEGSSGLASQLDTFFSSVLLLLLLLMVVVVVVTPLGTIPFVWFEYNVFYFLFRYPLVRSKLHHRWKLVSETPKKSIRNALAESFFPCPACFFFSIGPYYSTVPTYQWYLRSQGSHNFLDPTSRTRKNAGVRIMASSQMCGRSYSYHTDSVTRYLQPPCKSL